ncbi:DUF1850 domain-containing protein [Marinisporobacter balticus]|uniref:DUF1850 domain-containing protein n=1 Tax=Marinisporobacter balticus TaxID=2018667 RepID=A0A4R2KTY8_9FIRM|nr:DUF1850 domain-containing protein [Marinisporobacter balticus]TCO70175.1 hypothetical protein EV214_1279 [Marinisporobacter balticus]
MWDFQNESIFGKKIVIACILCIGLIVLCSKSFLKEEKVLIVEDLDKKMKTEYVLPDKTFTLGYIHSVLLTPAEEYFKVEDDNNLMLYKTIYESFGVGLPFSQEKWEFDIKNGKFILNIKRSCDLIHLRVSPIPKHWLSIGEDRYELINLVKEPEDLVKIYAVDQWGFKVGKQFYKVF